MAPETLNICLPQPAPMGRRPQAVVLVPNSEHCSELYTTGIMTSRTVYAIVGSRKPMPIRKRATFVNCVHDGVLFVIKNSKETAADEVYIV